MRSGILVVQILVLSLVAVLMRQPAHGQEHPSNSVRLFRLDGTFSSELPTKIDSEGRSEAPPFALRNARLEAENIGPLTRFRSVLTIANPDSRRRITEVEWRLDVYDGDLHSLSQSVGQRDKLNIYAGETAAASAKFGAVLPDRMVVLLQLVKVSFADGSAWSTPEECSLGGDLRTVSCKSK